MRNMPLFLAALLVWGFGVQASWADQQARAVIKRSIDALGGEEKLEKHQAATWQESGTYYGMGDGLPYKGNYAVQWPDKFRVEIVGVFTIVLNGDKGWFKTDDGTVPLSEEQLKQQQRQHYAGWVTTLLPLKDAAFKLSHQGDFEVNGKAAEGVRVQREGKPDVDLFFDKQTGLLVKSWHRTVSPEQDGQEVDQEVFYDNYQEVDGAKIPMKIVIKQDGKNFVEAENSNVQPVGKLDDSVFAEP